MGWPWLRMPLHPQDERVEQNASHNDVLESRRGDDGNQVSACRWQRRQICLDEKGLSAVDNLLPLNPSNDCKVVLPFCHQVVSLVSLLLAIVVDDDTNTQVEHKEATYEHECNESRAADNGILVSHWLHHLSVGIDSGVHHIDPTFCGCDLKERQDAIAHMIEVLVLVHPSAALLNANCSVANQSVAIVFMRFGPAEAFTHALQVALFVALVVLAEELMIGAEVATGLDLLAVTECIRAEGLLTIGTPHDMIAPGSTCIAEGRRPGIASDLTDRRIPSGSHPLKAARARTGRI
mmetsp:Transcript_8924/g.20854  ORF Transcript_8924/g.20854 Transcript_8924/m.20854 type:complete len:293 (-) Transcript_8924:3373-4251(-)